MHNITSNAEAVFFQCPNGEEEMFACVDVEDISKIRWRRCSCRITKEKRQFCNINVCYVIRLCP